MNIETKDELGRVYYNGEIFDSLSHFYADEDRYRVIDKWGKIGWAIGYRDWVPGTHKGSGFGGQIWVLYDGDGSLGGVHPKMLSPL